MSLSNDTGALQPDCLRAQVEAEVERALLGRGIVPRRGGMREVPTLSEFICGPLRGLLAVSAGTASEYQDLLRLWILPELGAMRLDEISPSHVAGLMPPMLARGLSPSRINRMTAVLRLVMNHAERSGCYPGPNPARSARLLREESREHFLDRVQFSRLLALLPADPDPIAASAIALLALTGARRSEVLHARWADVDLGRGLLTVPLSKSGRRRRVVLSDAAVSVLRRQLQAPGQVYVFRSPRRAGRPLEGVRSAWDRAKVAVPLPPETRLHDLRHTFASLCVDNGVPLYEVSKLLGHSNLSVTARYAHLRDERLISAANGVGAIAVRANVNDAG